MDGRRSRRLRRGEVAGGENGVGVQKINRMGESGRQEKVSPVAAGWDGVTVRKRVRREFGGCAAPAGDGAGMGVGGGWAC